MKLRVPTELKKRLEDAARRQHRSLNNEMVIRLQRSFDGYRSGS